VQPDIFEDNPKRYEGMGLRDLADEMFDAMKNEDRANLLVDAFGHLPVVRAYIHTT
jgi:arginine/lysine/ornithine decarboxylase